jgi:hypothetical protein
MSRSPKRKSEEVVRTAPKGCFATPRSKSVYHGGGEYPIERDWPARLLASVSPGSGWERIADLLESGRLDDAKQEWVSEQGPRILAVRVLNYLASENRAELDAHQWKGPSAELARLLGGLSRAGAAMYRKPTAEHVRKLRSYCADIRACLQSQIPTSANGSPSFRCTPIQLRALVGGISASALRKFARTAGVSPRRGKNDSYTIEDVRRILIAIRDNAQSQRHATTAARALERFAQRTA